MWYQKLFRLRAFSYFLSSYSRLRARVRGKRQSREEPGLKPQSLQKFALFYFFPRRRGPTFFLRAVVGSEERKTTTRGLEILHSAMKKLINPLRGKAHLKMTGLLVVFFSFSFKSLNWYRFGSSNILKISRDRKVFETS